MGVPRKRVTIAAQPADRAAVESAAGDRDADERILEVTGLCSRYGPIEALRQVDLQVRAGEIVVVLGANGAGKTTLLHSLMGMVSVGEGSIVYRGVDVTHESPEAHVRHGMALCPEGRRIFGKLTVEENLRLGGAVKSRAEYVGARAHVFELFPVLERLRSRHAGYLSGGEQQQLAIARALMSSPRLLLLDEPSLGLAPRIITVIFELIARLRDEGATILLVEQNVRLALEIADRGYVLSGQRIRLSGTPDALRENDELTASYLGLAAG
jgi:branched-chain amino acid transport system ATP-binding protein